MSAGWLPLLIAAPLLGGLVAWLWRRPTRHRDPDQSTGGSDFSNYANPNWGHPWGANTSGDGACGASESSGDGGGDGGCGGDGGGD